MVMIMIMMRLNNDSRYAAHSRLLRCFGSCFDSMRSLVARNTPSLGLV